MGPTCIEESGRTFGDRFREHLGGPSSNHQHSQSTGHQVDLECFIIIDRVAQGATRKIKEAMYIRMNDPSLNRSLGKYNPTCGMKYYRTPLHCSLSNHTSFTPPPTNVHLPHIPHTTWGAQNFFIGKFHPFPPPSWGCIPVPLLHLFMPLTQNYIHSGSILVIRHFNLYTVQHFPIDLMKWLQYESWSVPKILIYCVSAHLEIK